MPEVLSKITQQIRDFWRGLEKSQKKRLYITSAIVVVAVTAGIILLTRPSHMTLFTSSDQKQIGEMSDILNESSIWNEIQNNGQSIVIDSSSNNRAQVLLAQKGYPKAGMTFEDAINMIGITTTESDKKHIWRNQQISDIEAKLMLLDNIESAAVTLAVPDRNIFATGDAEKARPTANIVVKPKDVLTPQQVQGIISIVSRSVEGLEAKDVTVVDNNANVLNPGDAEDSISVANSQEDLRGKRENDIENKVREYFNVGQFDNFDTFRVVANAVLDFDKQKSQSKTLANPDGMDGGALISNESLKEKVTNAGASGVPGTDTNPGEAPTYQFGTGDTGTYDKQHNISNFGYNETVTENEKATGKLVPEESSMAISLWYGKQVTDDAGLTEDFINQVKLGASTATGIPVNNISVNKYKMAQPEVLERSAQEAVRQFLSDYGFFILMLLLIAALLLAVRPRGKRAAEEAPRFAVAAAAAAPDFGPKYAVPEPTEPLPEIEIEERSEIKKQIDKFVKQKPDAVAQLLRNWLSDEWDV